MSAEAFSLLHPGVQKAIYRRGWSELLPIQVASIHALLRGSEHLLICAQTAGGKTEAAFLPVISVLATAHHCSVRALYIGPLVALINDQFSRLESLCSDVEVPVHRWHGAASASEKRKLRDSPGGILLITPESLESNFINYGNHLRRIYAELDFVVIDELHSFLSSVRGVHLRSLLARLSAATGRKPRVIGLSATLGDPQGARAFIAPDSPESVIVIHGEGGQAVKFGIKAYLRGGGVSAKAALDLATELTPEQTRSAHPFATTAAFEEKPPATKADELDQIAADIMETCSDGTNLIFANAKQGLEVLADRLHGEAKRRHISPDPFHVHHGSLSKDVREETETVLRSGKPATVLCSSTLEMGIDIGSVKRVAQLDPPWSVAAMRQRLGRSGRRSGEAAVMRIYTRDNAPRAGGELTEMLYPKLLRTIALARLMLAKWLEPHDTDRLELSTLVHQILSCLRETGGMSASKLFEVLIENGAFRNVDQTVFLDVLRSLGSRELVEQIPTGEVILAPDGERITAARDFYASFEAAEEFTVRHDAIEIGKLQSTLIPPVGENIILAGRRWRVDDINPMTKSVHVFPSKGGKAPIFVGTAGDVHTRVIEEIAVILADSDEPAYLNLEAKLLLRAAREAALRSDLLARGFIVRPDAIQWFPWLGTRGLLTLELHARCDGLKTARDELSITYHSTDTNRLRAHLESVATNNRTALELARQMLIKAFDKFDDLLSEDLLNQANACNRLDLSGAQSRASLSLENDSLSNS